MDHLVNQQLFGGIYRDKKILITGITGFKGSWLARWLQMMGANIVGIGLKPDTTPNHFDLLGLKYRDVDIRNTEKLGEAIKEEQPALVFHMAAQALVRKSYSEPVTTYDTNVLGSLNVYNACRSLSDLKGILSITSDKVYENKEQYHPYKETDELGGYDMYSSSKACMEIMTSSYIRSYKDELNFPIVTARAGNVIGGGDWAADRLIPDLVRATNESKAVTIRYPEAVRPWQHVLEPLSGYLVLGQKLLTDKSAITGAWNFGPGNQQYFTVKEVLQIAQNKWNKICFELEEQKENLHEAGILAVDSTKANTLLDWRPVWGTEKAIEMTIDWYKSFLNEKNVNTNKDILGYVEMAKDLRLNWATV